MCALCFKRVQPAAVQLHCAQAQDPPWCSLECWRSRFYLYDMVGANIHVIAVSLTSVALMRDLEVLRGAVQRRRRRGVRLPLGPRIPRRNE